MVAPGALQAQLEGNLTMLAVLIIVALAALIAGGWAFFNVPWFNKWAKDSESIVAMRVISAFGGVLTALGAADGNDLTNALHAIVTAVPHPEIVWPVIVVLLPMFINWLRKRRDPKMMKKPDQ